MDRIKFGNEESNPPWYFEPDGSCCPDCGISKGFYHKLGCDREQCPVCGQQLIGCEHGEFSEDETIQIL